MATMWRKAMLYLGLGPDSEYDDYDPAYDDPAPSPVPSRPTAPLQAHEPEPSAVGAVRPMGTRPESSAPDFAAQIGAGGPAGQPSGLGGIGPVTPSSSVGEGLSAGPRMVRPMPVSPSARPRVLTPGSFNEAQTLADTFKGGQPVVIDLRQADREVSRRLIDFSSGLCYGLGGRMEKVDGQVYLVSPASAEVSEDERQRLRDRDYQV